MFQGLCIIAAGHTDVPQLIHRIGNTFFIIRLLKTNECIMKGSGRLNQLAGGNMFFPGFIIQLRRISYDLLGLSFRFFYPGLQFV
jgi:hypothetical protein